MIIGLIRSLWRFKVQIAFIAAVVILLGLGITANRAADASAASNGRVQHTYEVLGNLDQLTAALAVAQSSSRGFAITGEEAYLRTFHAAAADAISYVARLALLTSDNPEQQERIPSLRALMARNIQLGSEVIAARRSNGLEAAARGLGEAQHRILELERLAEEMKASELELLEKRNAAAQASVWHTKKILWLATILGALLTSSAGIGVVRDMRARNRAERELFEEKSGRK